MSRVVCVAPGLDEPMLAPLIPLLAAELNVKVVELARTERDLVTLEAKANFRTLGKKFGPRTPLAALSLTMLLSLRCRTGPGVAAIDCRSL